MRVAAFGAGAAIVILPTIAALAETFDNPAEWKAPAYTDFAVEDEGNAPYFEIWRREIGDSNAAALAKGIAIPAGYQAHIEEAHWSIRSAPKIAAVSILDFRCDPTPVFSNAALDVVQCPTRTVIWSGPAADRQRPAQKLFHQAEKRRPRDVRTSGEEANARNGLFMAFDVASQSIKTGVLVEGKALNVCSHYLPLAPQ